MMTLISLVIWFHVGAITLWAVMGLIGSCMKEPWEK